MRSLPPCLSAANVVLWGERDEKGIQTGAFACHVRSSSCLRSCVRFHFVRGGGRPRTGRSAGRDRARGPFAAQAEASSPFLTKLAGGRDLRGEEAGQGVDRELRIHAE